MMKPILLFLCLLITISCSRKTDKKPAATSVSNTVSDSPIAVKADEFKKGEVISSVNLLSDSTQKFALYLPTKFDHTKTYPVIIFFDPHGEGSVPLNLYYKLAEKYQVILMGSNTSKNGLDIRITEAIGSNLIKEAGERFSADKNKIDLCGFSGGAKVALNIGSKNASVSSIIYCGAAIQFNPSHPISILGFAGTRDMNYTDVVSFDRSLKSAPFNHQIVEWNGKHEFPTAEIFKDAFDFLSSGKIENINKKQASISSKEMEAEQIQKQKYLDAFQSKDLNWWKKEINNLNAKKSSNLMFERLLGFISLVCYSYTSGSIANNDLQSAERIFELYQLADPKNESIPGFKKEIEKLRKR